MEQRRLSAIALDTASYNAGRQSCKYSFFVHAVSIWHFIVHTTYIHLHVRTTEKKRLADHRDCDACDVDCINTKR